MTFQLKDIPNLILMIGLGAIVIGVSVTVTSELSTDLGNNASGVCATASSVEACSATKNGTVGLRNMAKKLPLIGTITALAIVLGVVFTALAFRSS